MQQQIKWLRGLSEIVETAVLQGFPALRADWRRQAAGASSAPDTSVLDCGILNEIYGLLEGTADKPVVNKR
ncbi:MAG TPA: hypothetical protein VGR02_08415 [Thermoanaerobaculia bacterium]|jgi:hypothetical protein|nr:hypothetical protein [Thermoanaerobaculia bacterium]